MNTIQLFWYNVTQKVDVLIGLQDHVINVNITLEGNRQRVISFNDKTDYNLIWVEQIQIKTF